MIMMQSMMPVLLLMKYVDSKVWLKVPGGVEGWNLEDLNARIDEWNSLAFKFIRTISTFFEWLSYEEGRTIYGFSALWNSTLDSDVHHIKGCNYGTALQLQSGFLWN